jgi:hypothetical protein
MNIDPWIEIERICEKFGYPAPIRGELYLSVIMFKLLDAMQGMEKRLDEFEKQHAEEKAIRGCL